MSPKPTHFLEPGMLVTHATQPEWGMGQVQSVIGDKVTVTFEHAGKTVIIGKWAELLPVVERPLR